MFSTRILLTLLLSLLMLNILSTQTVIDADDNDFGTAQWVLVEDLKDCDAEDPVDLDYIGNSIGLTIELNANSQLKKEVLASHFYLCFYSSHSERSPPLTL